MAYRERNNLKGGLEITGSPRGTPELRYSRQEESRTRYNIQTILNLSFVFHLHSKES
jgi:hypothetical protein